MATEGPLGRFEVNGRTVSARLNPQLLIDASEKEAVDLTFQDVLDAASMSGGSRKMKGGTALTRAAARKLIEDIIASGRAVGDSLDNAAAKFIAATPYIATGAAAKIAFDHPTVFATIFQLASKGLTGALGSHATWGTYAQAAQTVASSLASTGSTIVSSAASGPYIPFLIASMVMVRRAQASGTSLLEQIKSDASAVKSAAGNTASRLVDAAKTVTQNQVAAFKDAYVAQAKKNPIEDLREIAGWMAQERTMPTTSMTMAEDGYPTETVTGMPDPGAPIREMAKKAVPIVPKPKPVRDEEGNVIPQVKSPKGMASTTKGRQTSMKQYLKPKAATSSSPGSDTMEDADLGGRRRKTRKPKKVRRVTRRRRAIVY